MRKYIKTNLSTILFSFFFALVLLLDTKLTFNGESISAFTNVMWGSFFFSDILWFCFFFCITYVLLTNIVKFYNKIPVKDGNKKKLPIFKISFFVLVIAWLPYLLTYFPGGVFYDTFASIKQVENGFSGLTNHNPVLYTLILKLFTTLGELTHVGLKGGLFYFLVVQYITCTLILSYAVKVIYKKQISKWYAYGTLLFFALFSLVPFYVISIWKDTPFSFVLFLFITFLLDKGFYFANRKKDFLCYLLLALLICFLRNNGILIILGMTFLIFLGNKNKKFLLSSGGLLLIVLFIQGPIYSHFHMNGSTFLEASAIPFQQITYSIREGIELEEADYNFIKSVMPLGTLKGAYTSVNFDTIKFHESFDSYTFSSGKKEFLRLWLKLLPKNFNNYVEAYLLQTLGFWDYLRGNDTAYIQNTIWKNDYHLEQTDLIEKVSGISLKKVLEPKVYLSSALFVWVSFLSMVLVVQKKKYKHLLYYAPCIVLWVSIMIGTPIAFSLRYVYVFVLFLPFSFIIPLLSESERK